MPKKQHTDEQIIFALRQHEGGEKTADICRRLDVSQATFYLWKIKLGRTLTTKISSYR
ncbi:transposase [Pseudacidobacterium ailaaui]|jgi:putative transposase|uniref:transposase n=1 Tax=Pseudacidobacterium ailaaui TaxID=1382359 RepID=UPI0009DF7955|nr:transposase [Pseudacidobacterium ailaaui]